MAFFTKSEAQAAAKRAMGGRRTAQEVLKSSHAQLQQTKKFDIFLSHSISDAVLVLGVKTLLEEQGHKVYVDWVEDTALERSQITEKTAGVLRERMRQSDSLLYLATDNASTSKWMPWELGYFDGFKPGKVSILPVMDRADQTFAGQEYLGLYPKVTKETISKRKVNPARARDVLRTGLHTPPFDINKIYF